MSSCDCSIVTNKHRKGSWSEHAVPNDYAEEEVVSAKKHWVEVGKGDMTFVFKCSLCGQLWGQSPAGHGWSSYRRLEGNYEFEAF